MDEIIKDERFKHIATDSRFRVMRKNERKFKVDTRFKKMFHDDKFKLKYSVDKRGKPIALSTNDNLKKFYELSESEADDDKKETTVDLIDPKIGKDLKEESETENESDEENASETGDESDATDTSDEEDDEDTEEEDAVEEIPWNEFDKDTVRSDDISNRLAICNMDWDRIKAEDLFITLNSFKPANGIIKSVKIYLSQFGAERMEYERVNGPQELTQNQDKNEAVQEPDSDDDGADDEEKSKYFDDDEDDGDNVDRLKLRTYQFNRLKYYYAVVDCDTPETANRIYTECDGLEYESSCTRLDLRFIPDDVSFEDNKLVQSCVESPDPLTYQPNLFFTTALNQTKVECTWDETPRDRLAITMKKYTEEDLKSSNFKSILASGSEDENEDEIDNNDENKTVEKESENDSKKKTKKNKKVDEEDDGIQKYKDLLFGQDAKFQKKREADMEFCWEGGVEDDDFDEDDDDDLLVSKKKSAPKAETKSHKKKDLTEEEIKEQAQLSLLTMDNDDVGKAHFNLDDLLIDKNKKTKKKNRKELEADKEKKTDDFELNVNDPRFNAIFYDHKFNIDPSDQSFKKTKAMENLLDEKSKRKFSEFDDNETQHLDDSNKSTKLDHSALLLVKSIKSRNEVLERKKLQTKEKQKALKNKLRLLK